MKRLFILLLVAVFGLSACETTEVRNSTITDGTTSDSAIRGSEPIRTQPMNVFEEVIKVQALGAQAVTVDSGNLFSNGSFESGLDDWGACDEGKISVTSKAYEGSNALSLEAGNCFYQSVEASAGQEFTLSCYVSVVNGNDWTGMGLSFSDSAWTQLSDAAPAIISGSEYHRYDVNAIAPANSSYVSMWLYSDNDVVVDSCSLMLKVEPPVPPVPSGSNLLENGDFETLNAANKPTEWSKDCGGSWEVSSDYSNELHVLGGACVDQGLSAGDVAALAGNNYTYSCSATNSGGYASISVFFDDVATSIEIPANGQYQQVELKAKAPNASNGFVSIYSEGDLVIDDCSLTVSGGNTIPNLTPDRVLTVNSGIFDIENNTMAVGFPEDNLGTGKVVLYAESASGWTQTAELFAPDTTINEFGRNVEFAEGVLYIRGRGSNSQDVVHLFFNNNGVWQIGQTIADPNFDASQLLTGYSFGYKIIAKDDLLLIRGGATSAGARCGRGWLNIYTRESNIADWQFVKIVTVQQQIFSAYIDDELNIYAAGLPCSGPASAVIFQKDLGGVNNWGRLQSLSASSNPRGIFDRGLGGRFARFQDTLIVGGALGVYVFNLTSSTTAPWQDIGIIDNFVTLPIEIADQNNQFGFVGFSENRILLRVNDGEVNMSSPQTIYVIDSSNIDPRSWQVTATLQINLDDSEIIAFKDNLENLGSSNTVGFSISSFSPTDRVPFVPKRILTFDIP